MSVIYVQKWAYVRSQNNFISETIRSRKLKVRFVCYSIWGLSGKILKKSEDTVREPSPAFYLMWNT